MARDSILADTVVPSAQACAAFTAAHRLATWVGEGRPVTPRQALRPVDLPAAAQALAIPVPGRVRRAADVPAVHRQWKLAMAVGFLRIVDGHARPGPALTQWPDVDDGAVRELWLTGLAAGFAARSPTVDDAGAITFARVVLAALTPDPEPSGELWRRARAALTDGDSDAAYEFFTTWRRRADPFGDALDTLAEFGAADRHGAITPLGQWALQELQARAPQPITTDIAAGELLARLADIEPGQQWYAAQPWLAGRTELRAARDLLSAAVTATPAQRIAAVELVHALGPQAERAWDGAADIPNLAAHARAVEWDNSDARDSNPADRAWLAVEYAAAALTSSGPDEALTRLDERLPEVGLDSLLRAVECGAHPATAELTEALTTFLASDATPSSSQAYQLKISLNGRRTPVWRRVLVPASTRLGVLHRVIQIVMDWDGDHLHAFTVGQRHYGDPFLSPDLDDEEQLRCGDAFANTRTIAYRYDFGACWNHTVTCEQVSDLVEGTTYPRCIAGRGDSPVEDWISGPESTPFDQDEINRSLAGHPATQDM